MKKNRAQSDVRLAVIYIFGRKDRKIGGKRKPKAEGMKKGLTMISINGDEVTLKVGRKEVKSIKKSRSVM